MRVQAFARKLNELAATTQPRVNTYKALNTFNKSFLEATDILIDELFVDTFSALLEDLFNEKTGRRRSLTACEVQLLLSLPSSMIEDFNEQITIEERKFLLASVEEYLANKPRKLTAKEQQENLFSDAFADLIDSLYATVTGKMRELLTCELEMLLNAPEHLYDEYFATLNAHEQIHIKQELEHYVASQAA